MGSMTKIRNCTEGRAKKKAKPTEFTERMTLHLNGGDKFSELHYEIYRNGEKTKITHHVRTDGSPSYLILADEFHAGEATFDRKETKGKGLTDWLKAHA